MSAASETYTLHENILRAFIKDILNEEFQEKLKSSGSLSQAADTQAALPKYYTITMKSGRIFFHTDSRSCHELSQAIAAKNKNINLAVDFITFFAPEGYFALNVAEIESIEEMAAVPTVGQD